MNRYIPLHESWGDYTPQDPIPCIEIKGRTRDAVFLGKSLNEALIEYWVGEKFHLVKINLLDQVVRPQQSMARAKYDQKYWKKDENFAMLENAALNGAVWHGEIALYDVYDSERMRRALLKPKRIRKVKKIAEWAIGAQQLELPGFETIERAARLS
jgi:hypothetical protein